MGTQSQLHKIREQVPADVPDERDYETIDNAELDRAMVDAIHAAEDADNDYLARLLALELGSHYYETR